VISGFCCEVNESYTLLGYYAGSSDNSNFKGLEDETDSLSQNVGKESPPLTA
jgi:hypothetical protein